ncbi:hypothetical protein RE6C_00991 [Rhodopirellula europaea 6C]|uniref:Uncharacterized protein n=1 Tax=Rhodopirellula europaea 6C TaxID=1263867 RepID=M2B7Z4_9BACT|nr:hypothetical protein RE6C_00991 [Rhodopirellula europaea 6C]
MRPSNSASPRRIVNAAKRSIVRLREVRSWSQLNAKVFCTPRLPF